MSQPWLNWQKASEPPKDLLVGTPVLCIDENRELGMAWYMDGVWDSDDKTIDVTKVEYWAEVPLP